MFLITVMFRVSGFSFEAQDAQRFAYHEDHIKLIQKSATVNLVMCHVQGPLG